MSSTESFDELEQKFAERMEEALSEIREEFLERLQGARLRLDEDVKAELVTARQEAAAIAASAAEAETAAEESRIALLAEAEEAKSAAIAEALEAKETEFAEILAARDDAIAGAAQARDAALAEAEEARSALLAEAEEAKSAAIGEALEVKEREFSELLAAKEAGIAELEDAKTTALAEAAEKMEAAVAEARSAAEEAVAEAVGQASLQFHEVVAKIDAAGSQSEILEALLGGSARYASRSLLFLTREDGLQGWGGHGFDTSEGQLQEVHLNYEDRDDWAELSKGRGTVKMGSETCGDICRAIDGSAPADGALIPLVLRDSLAAALYADRLEGHGALQLAMLQILTYAAGQALEALPLRQRSATATLRMAIEVPAEESGLELWQYLAPAEPVEEVAPEAVEEPALVPAEPEELVAEEAWVEPVEPPAPVDEIPEPETPQWQEAAEEVGFDVEEAEEPTFEEPVAEVVEEEVIEVAEETIEEVAPLVVEEPVAEIEPPVEAEPVAEIEPPVAVEAPAEVAPPIEVAPPTEVTPPTEVAPPAAGAEVAAPEDVDGPGWAFTTRRFSGEGSEDATHEEARRLARLLVTEIKLYNEEQVEEGRRSRNIYRALKEDIDRSRQIFEERIDESVRMETDYFQEELVKILAAGDTEILGT
jgi:hypothetical protein